MQKQETNNTFIPKITLNPYIGTFDILEYLNSLPLSTRWIDVSNKGLTFLPDLSRFKNLDTLVCCNNELTSLPNFNNSLERINCSFNKLTSLPPLNKKLVELVCHRNELTCLPPLNQELTYLDCCINNLTHLPPLNKKLKHLNFYDNNVKFLPILNNNLVYLDGSCNKILSNYQIYDCEKLFYKRKDIKRINKCTRFRELFYILKYKTKFLVWLLKSREKKIQEKYHPKYLLEFIENNPEADDEELDNFLNNW
jgi:hypothetical protein